MQFHEEGAGMRPGHSLVELVVVLLALSIIGVAMTTSLRLVTGIGRTAGDRAERLAAARTVKLVVGWEVANLVPGLDGLAVAADSLALRAFRGRGVVCAKGAASMLNYRGLRLPDPAKDSMLVLAGVRTERMLPLTGSRTAAGACTAAPGEQTIAVSDTGLAVADVVLFFERGAYHLSGGALRYRRGAGGRQPVTAAALDPDSSGFGLSLARKTAAPSDTAGLEIRTGDELAPPGTAAPAWRVRVPIRNIRLPLDSTT